LVWHNTNVSRSDRIVPRVCYRREERSGRKM